MNKRTTPKEDELAKLVSTDRGAAIHWESLQYGEGLRRFLDNPISNASVIFTVVDNHITGVHILWPKGEATLRVSRNCDGRPHDYMEPLVRKADQEANKEQEA